MNYEEMSYEELAGFIEAYASISIAMVRDSVTGGALREDIAEHVGMVIEHGLMDIADAIRKKAAEEV